ncbi:MAG: MtrB/PioB family decaheme-associated outer membrane protein [Wenzhouxiangellaceae bacterium]
MNTINRVTFILRPLTLAMLLALSTGVAFGQDEEAAAGIEPEAPPPTVPAGWPEPPDISRWSCRNCEYDRGWNGNLDFGTGFVSDDLFEFGDNRGFDDRGLFVAAGLDLRYRDEQGRFASVYGEDLGLESRDIVIEIGRQGLYSAWLDYDEISHLRAGDTRSPFIGAGTSDQRLPAGWVRGQVTGDMTALAGSLRRVDLRSKREIFGLGFEFSPPAGPFEYRAEVSRTSRDGNHLKGGSFIFRAAELAAPIRYETTQFDASVAYLRRSWELQAEYNLSLFDNRNQAIRFENPFIGINGASIGELAEPPDNQFHQFMISGSWRPTPLLMLAGQIAFGKAEQDEALLDATLNPNLPNPTLPRARFDGEVDTRVVNLRATSRLTRKLSARLGFRYNERDNNSSRDQWTQVVSDTFVIGERFNEPYSHERTAFDAELDYRLLRWLRLSVEGRFSETERDFQEVSDTDTERYALTARINPTARLNVRLEGRLEERDNDLNPALLGPQENPSLRRFHFAEKERDVLRGSADYAFTDSFSAGVFYEYADEDYSDTRIGLSRARSESVGVDFAAAFGDTATAHAFFAWEHLDGVILGGDNVGGAAWRAEQEDEFRTAGLGLRIHNLPWGWRQATLDVTWADASGDIRVDRRGSFGLPFPELETRRFTVEASAERRLRDHLDLSLSYLVGRLTEQDFFRDLVEPDTLPTLLSLGEGTPGGTVHVVSAMLRYRFQ